MRIKRERWINRPAFVFAAIGSAAGLGNAWRFPYIAYQNGGGAFLIPFFIALFTAGIPLLILEYGLGQKMQAGAPGALGRIKKSWEGLGWWAVFIGFVIMSYYAVIMAWTWNYIYASLSVAWEGRVLEFFYRDVLNSTDGPLQLGPISVPVLIGLLLTWFLIWLILRRGVKFLGKVVLITVPLPIILLLILGVRAVTLPGSMEGLTYYLQPDFRALLDYNVWVAAYSQVFFTLSVGFGVMIAYASYLPRKSDINNNAIITALADAGISFLAGFVVFGTLGYMAGAQNVDVGQVVEEGIGLAFIAYPEAISLLPFGAAFFGFIFFFTLLTLGIDSAFSLAESVITGLDDKFKLSRPIWVTLVCTFGFLVGLIFSTGAGLWWLDIVDHFVNNFGLAAVGLLECLLIGWVYRAEKMRNYVNPVSDVKLGKWWDIMIKYVTPLILGISIILTLSERLMVPYRDYPAISLLLGGWMVVLLLIPVALIFARKKASRPGFLQPPQ